MHNGKEIDAKVLSLFFCFFLFGKHLHGLQDGPFATY